MRGRSSSADLEILFIGGVMPRDEEAHVIERTTGPVDMAANALQWNLITGLDQVMRAPVTLVNAMFVRTFPRFYRDAWVRGRRWSHAPGAEDESIGFPNLFGIKHLWRALAVARKARRWVRTRRPRTSAIVVYAMHAPFVIAGAFAKRLDPGLKLCLVVPDLPEHMNLGQKRAWIFTFLKKIDRWVMIRLTKRFDCFVLLTKHMAGQLGVGERPWIVVEGVVNPKEIPELPVHAAVESPEKIVLYTGTLANAYGILQLLEAFELIGDPRFRLWICGAGEAEREVKSAAERDGRVRYHGRTSREVAMALQRQATVLVNPRPDTADFTRYSFPSKILEYMLSGTPTIVRKLPGIPDDYYDHLFVVDGPSAADLSATIVRVCAMSETDRARWGARAQQFLLREKDVRTQASRILQLIHDA